MKAVILYRPNSDHERTVLDYVRDYKRLHPDKNIDLLSLDTVDGADKARLYDITQYPSVMVLTNDGQLQKFWQGELFPLFNELDSYMLV